jgi:hypothetical protein
VCAHHYTKDAIACQGDLLSVRHVTVCQKVVEHSDAVGTGWGIARENWQREDVELRRSQGTAQMVRAYDGHRL